MTAALVVLFHVLGFTSSIHAVMSTRTSQGAIAWAVTLNTFPYLAVPAYWVFGRSKFQGYVVARRTKDDRNDRIEQEVIRTVAPYRVPEAERAEAVVAGPDVAALVRRMPTKSRKDSDAICAELLGGGAEALDRVYGMIKPTTAEASTAPFQLKAT